MTKKIPRLAARGQTQHGDYAQAHMPLCKHSTSSCFVWTFLCGPAERRCKGGLLPVVMDNIRRYLAVQRVPWPWTRRDHTPNESSPLIPKGEADEVAHRNSELHQLGASDEKEPVSKQIHPHYCIYSFTDYFLKYLLVLSNLMFSVMGLLVLGLGMWGLISKESFAQERIGSIGTDPMLLLVTAGLLLTLLCLSGCVGALRENDCLLKVFSGTLLVLITAQVLALIVVYTVQGEIGNVLRSGMLAAIAGYQDDLDLRFITDELQSNLQCCGADTYRDWEINIYYNCSAPGVLACGVPATCCLDPLENGTVWNSQCGLGAQTLDEFSAQSVIFLGGCLGEISRWVQQHQGLIGTIVAVVLGVQILTVFVTTRLQERIHWHKVNA
ncbi:tetraspanin-10 [Dunckerocampus dactyliophorus]|uniref:tetraspanin-10 n=1 Tax=Dunckerocampus dactyliophorus TaxID=161453 RepID=UPI0024050EA8|nr:tetraspanin-10 [Dunckerocampus dactyliophorus]XP_054615522.1 tetraspanin-10 [Dunckerocampus dactyliophorus]